MAQKKLHRDTDSNDGGGILDLILQTWVFDEGLLVSVNGSLGTGHAPSPHAYHEWETTGGSDFVTIDGIPVNIETQADTCGHVRENGSSLTDLSS
jgi:hypothetical protein